MCIRDRVSTQSTWALTADQQKKQIHSLTIGEGYKLEDIGLNFTLQGYEKIELKPGGKDTLLTIDNLEEYLDLTVLHTLYQTISPQILSFRKGFNIVFDVNGLKIFKGEELEDFVCGGKNEKWEKEMLLSYIVAMQGFTNSSPQYHFVLDYMSSLDAMGRRLFLQYVTGSPRLPFGGFAMLKPKLCIAKRTTPSEKNPDEFLPSVMTCQNYLKVPEYSSYSVLSTKFEYALKEGQSSFTLSQRLSLHHLSLIHI
eukprot:TRINITY_DN42842_c0_g1_i1.p1 TRINITY_DN42842_c0_g1~~TRINITY_DN42842_c0_g1_i1.p1  ORF type:complete len:254 (+),score=46.76 TRINITY_DN42842_c0_g1_i1:139-900(+)